MDSRLLKWIGGAAAALILGALGSGLWERALEPLLEIVGSAIVRGVGAVFSTYRDSIYSEAALGFHEKHSLVLLSLLLGVISGVYAGFWLFVYRKTKGGFREAGRSFIGALQRHQVAGVLALAVLIMSLFLSLKAKSANRVTTWSLNSVEILAPHVGANSRLELRSEFFSIESASDFEKFEDKVVRLAEENGVDLETINAP